MGRPTDYKSEYCEELIQHMAEGFSFESFAGKVRASKQTIYDWLDAHPEFLDAKKEAFEQSRLFWESVGINLTTGKLNGNPTTWIFNMKNRFKQEWRDKQEVEQSGTITKQIIYEPQSGNEPIKD